ncbi:hypothetical protein ABTF15_17560, partial [Acinetobacter baumannii]
MNNLNFKTLKKYWLRFVGIAVIAGALILAFAWTAGLFGHRTTSKTFLGDTLKNFDPGYRRAHGKGIVKLLYYSYKIRKKLEITHRLSRS